MKKLKKGLTIVVPALNEEFFIKRTINKINSSLKGLKVKYQVFIVDDGSNDNTFNQAVKITKKNKKIKVFKNNKNYGMGFCLKICAQKSKYNKILLIPGDDSFSASAIKNLAINCNKSEFIAGYRVNYFEIVSIFRKITFFSISSSFVNSNKLFFSSPSPIDIYLMFGNFILRFLIHINIF